MTKKLLYFVIAAALICGASVFTSCTNDDNPVTPDARTVLASMDFKGHPFYGDLTYSYAYDDDCRLVKMKEEQVGTGLVITEFPPHHLRLAGRRAALQDYRSVVRTHGDWLRARRRTGAGTLQP